MAGALTIMRQSLVAGSAAAAVMALIVNDVVLGAGLQAFARFFQQPLYQSYGIGLTFGDLTPTVLAILAVIYHWPAFVGGIVGIAAGHLATGAPSPTAAIVALTAGLAALPPLLIELRFGERWRPDEGKGFLLFLTAMTAGYLLAWFLTAAEGGGFHGALVGHMLGAVAVAAFFGYPAFWLLSSRARRQRLARAIDQT